MCNLAGEFSGNLVAAIDLGDWHGSTKRNQALPNARLQRTRFALLRSPLRRRPLGRSKS